MVAVRRSRPLRNQLFTRITVVWFLCILFILLAFSTTCLLVVDKIKALSVTKTIAGDNLEPTPWHPFPAKIFPSDGKYTRASQIFQCSYLTCSSPLRFIRSYMNKNELLHNTTHSCPALFQWIHEDLAQWRVSGITENNIKAAKEFAAFRVVIVDGRLYVDPYYACVQSRMMFTIWGLLQLLERYPGLVPDVDIMFDCMDKPKIERAKYRQSKFSPPPLFRYCSNRDHLDIPFPDWSFWGWSETNLAPWEEEFNNIKEGSKAVKWIDRKPTAYWKGNPDVSSPIRTKLLECNSSSMWGAEILRQNWFEEANAGYEQSKLANQCRNRYKIYTEGFAWSVSFKYILSCDSPVLVVTPKYYDFFTRGLMPRENYLPVRSTKLCTSIKFAVDWGNSHPAEAEAIGKGGQKFMEDLNMDNVYEYMFHLISEYSKLQKFTPQVPATAQEPCSLDPPNQKLFKKWTDKKTKVINDIEKMEDISQTKKKEVTEIQSIQNKKSIDIEKMEDISQTKKKEATAPSKVLDRNQRTQNKKSEDAHQGEKKKDMIQTKKTEDSLEGKNLGGGDMPQGKKRKKRSRTKKTKDTPSYRKLEDKPQGKKG
ncbi:hypothetical protein SUGI_0448240 [Cryptomeria japonica]|nr:hypothetical protein SUGI_0448240 [Cryptomeria japonica]